MFIGSWSTVFVVIPAVFVVIPAVFVVIPAKAGIHL